MKTPTQKLQKLRDQIDILDNKIIVSLAKRTDIVRKVGALKKEHSIEPRDTTRFNKLLKNKLSQAKKLDLPQNFIKELYNLIHEYSIKIEKK